MVRWSMTQCHVSTFSDDYVVKVGSCLSKHALSIQHTAYISNFNKPKTIKSDY